jgi:hypothetical protein
MKIQLQASTKPPLFRFSGGNDEPVILAEIRITEVGQTEPSWWLVYDDGWLDDAVALNILTAKEAKRADVVVTRDIGGPAATPGVQVDEVRYGQVPEGLKQNGSLHELKPNHLYHLVATGTTVGEVEFYG